MCSHRPLVLGTNQRSMGTHFSKNEIGGRQVVARFTDKTPLTRVVSRRLLSRIPDLLSSEIISHIPEGRSREINFRGLRDISQNFADFSEIRRFFPEICRFPPEISQKFTDFFPDICRFPKHRRFLRHFPEICRFPGNEISHRIPGISRIPAASRIL